MTIYCRRTTVGLLINNLDTEYQQEIWNGIEAVAKIRDLNVVVFEGGSLEHPDPYERLRNLVYDWISPSRIDGLIISTTTLGGFVGAEGLTRRFSDILKYIPAVCIGKGFPGLSSVSVDNHAGMGEIIDHLVTVHGKKKPVFIGGFERDQDTVDRLAAFRESFGRFGITPAEDRIIMGEYRTDIARIKLGAWIDEGHQLDAVIAANDEMAYGCYAALSSRGFSVPDDIALTGFDDISSSRRFTAPLSTIMQSTREMAVRAVEMLVDRIETGLDPKSLVLDSRAVIRQSCGCLSKEILGVDRCCDETSVSRPFRQSLEDAFLRIRDDAAESTGFLTLLRSFIIKDESMADDERCSWNDELTRLRRIDGVRESPACETALHQARIMVKEFSESALAGTTLRAFLRNRKIMYSVADFISAFSLSSLFERLRRSLPDLGVRSCFLSLFVAGTGKKRSRLLLCFLNHQTISLPADGIEFDSVDLFPRELYPADSRFNICTEMLFHESSILGMIALEMSGKDIAFGDVLTRQVRGALRSSMLLDELVDKDARLNAAFNQLSDRADDLERANALIKENQQQLIAAEKMASLGRLTAGIAHEMNTPLAAVRASIAELENLAREYELSIGDSEVTPEDNRAIAAEMRRSLALAASSAERASVFIRSIKNQTRESSGDFSGISFNAVPVIRDAIVLLAHALRAGRCKASLDLPSEPVMVPGVPGRLSQVVTNLVTNAIDAMQPEGGSIGVRLRAVDFAAELIVADEGCGIAQEDLYRIFEPLFTTKPFGVGTGLGLSIVHDIVTGDFRGHIAVTSEPGKGSSFIVSLPYNKGAQRVQEI